MIGTYLLQRKIYQAYEQAWPEFERTGRLPENYGVGLPEKFIELLFARSIYKPGLPVLDIGASGSQMCHQWMLRGLPAPRKIVGLDREELPLSLRRLYLYLHKADILGSGLAPRSFNSIWCVSTLEHVGLVGYGPGAYRIGSGHTAKVQAIEEMIQLLAPGGKLLVTVPYGRFEEHGWQVNFDAALWSEVLEPACRESTVRQYFYRYQSDGWANCAAEDLKDTGCYVSDNHGASGLAVGIYTQEG